MVDCGNARCIQERRVFKKELLTWSKKVPLVIGMELVAEELLGKDVVSDLLEPYNSLETEESADWEPATTCCFCHARTKFMLDAVKQSIEQEAGNGDNTGIHHLQQLLPFVYPPGAAQEGTADEGKPLDLSATSQTKSSRDVENGSPPSKPVVELKVPQIMKSGKKKDLNGKKSYTEDELAAAVSDIRSGKLGTRRAAVLYGIPRSTLRNKIFKLESETNHHSTENCGSQENKLSMVDLLQGVPNGDYQGMFPFSEESMLSNKLLFPGEEVWERKLDQIRRKHNLLEPQRKFGLPPMHYNSRQLSDFEKSYLNSPFSHELKLAFLPELVRKMAEERMEMERQHHHSLQSLQLDLSMPASMASVSGTGSNGISGSSNSNSGVELKIPSYKPMRSSYMNGFNSGPDHTPNHSRNHNASANPPPSSNSTSLTPKIGDTLKDIIAKTIAEKMRSRAMMTNSMQQLKINSNLSPAQNPGPLSSDSSSMSSNDMGPVEKKPRLMPRDPRIHEDKKTSSDGNSSSNEGKTFKKTRPKRGQYRKYNSQLLLEAVRAVQRGEMSVHRAGSYFGVPHSTLEYKVKERHLLRQKKPRDVRPGKKEGGSTSNTSGTAGTGSQPSSRADTPVSVSTPLPTNSAMSVISNLAHQASVPSMGLSAAMPLNLGWSPAANGTVSLLPHDTSMGSYSSGFALNTSASELLKKLQRKVQAKANMVDPAPGEMAAVLRAAAVAAAAAAAANNSQGNSAEATQVIAQ